MNLLEVKTSKLQFILVILLGLFFVPVGLLLVISAILNGFKVVFLVIGLMALIIYAVVFWMVLRAYLKSVKYFSSEALVCNNGKSYAWADLSRVVDQIRLHRVTNAKIIWRTEIQFKNGESAWLIPMKITNFPEVYEFVRRLPCEHTEVKV